MSHKQTQDKEKEGYPWTARQKRRLAGGRGTRKQSTGVMARMRKKEANKQAAQAKGN
jgi:hypothetical protein